ncbi:MAG: glycosyltransferase family 2 protein [Tepidisphaeraceae bacterium]|jgi:glycosyltransferase involved in cell wall biosynthesis
MEAATLPTVSIVTPSFNHAPFIEQTILSVLEQEYPKLEYLVIDGGSSDGTLDILKKYDGRLKYISEPDHGQADAINKGFMRSGGEILAWLNSDDTYASGAIRAVAEIFAAQPDIGVVYGDADFIDAHGNFIAPCAHIENFNRHRLLYYSDYLVQPAVFFRRAIFESAGGLDVSLNWAMDYDLWLKFAARTEFFYLRKTLAHYRWLGGSKTAGGGAARIEEVRRVALRYGARGLPAFFHLEAVRMHLAQATTDMREGHIGPAIYQGLASARSLLSSPRAIRSLFSPQTWRIIATGRKLRRSASGK